MCFGLLDFTCSNLIPNWDSPTGGFGKVLVWCSSFPNAPLQRQGLLMRCERTHLMSPSWWEEACGLAGEGWRLMAAPLTRCRTWQPDIPILPASGLVLCLGTPSCSSLHRWLSGKPSQSHARDAESRIWPPVCQVYGQTRLFPPPGLFI